MQKKTLIAVVAVLTVIALVAAGVYFIRSRGKGKSAATVEYYDLSGEPGELPDDWYVDSYEGEYLLDALGHPVLEVVPYLPRPYRPHLHRRNIEYLQIQELGTFVLRHHASG